MYNFISSFLLSTSIFKTAAVDVVISVDDYTPVPVVVGDTTPSALNSQTEFDNTTNLVAVTADSAGNVTNVNTTDVPAYIDSAQGMVYTAVRMRGL